MADREEERKEEERKEEEEEEQKRGDDDEDTEAKQGESDPLLPPPSSSSSSSSQAPGADDSASVARQSALPIQRTDHEGNPKPGLLERTDSGGFSGKFNKILSDFFVMRPTDPSKAPRPSTLPSSVAASGSSPSISRTLSREGSGLFQTGGKVLFTPSVDPEAVDLLTSGLIGNFSGSISAVETRLLELLFVIPIPRPSSLSFECLAIDRAAAAVVCAERDSLTCST